jgi:hypothetical protein
MKILNFFSESLNDYLNGARIVQALQLNYFFKESDRLKLAADVYRVDMIACRFDIDDREKRFQEVRVEVSLQRPILEVEEVKQKVEESVHVSLTFDAL